MLESAYPPALAESWDSVGLVCGDPADAVTRVVFAVDPTEAVVDDAIASGADLLVVHHPLLLRGGGHRRCSHTKGALVHKLIKAGCALFSAHTNADSADPPGVSDALAQALGLTVLRPIEPKPTQPLDKWVVMVPVENASAVQDALFEAGAGRIGDYSQCSWTVTGTGQFLPADGANPTIGTVALWSRFARIVWK